ncbi:MAG: translation initiation factor Sui1 [Desulfuromonadales bacterium]
MTPRNTRLVYSSESARICSKCQKYYEFCSCKKGPKQPTSPVKNDGIVRVGRETKGRKGKGVTTVTGAPLDGEGVKQLAKELKQKCGSGGTVRDGVIEIQGDHRDTLLALLAEKGWTVKRSGG